MSPVITSWAVDTGRRALLTAAQVAVAYISVAATIDKVDWPCLGLAVSLAIIVTILKQTAAANLWPDAPGWAQLLERTVATGAEAAVGAIGAAVLLTDVDWLTVAGIAGIAAALSLLTNIEGIAGTGSPPAGARWLDADGDGHPDVAD